MGAKRGSAAIGGSAKSRGWTGLSWIVRCGCGRCRRLGRRTAKLILCCDLILAILACVGLPANRKLERALSLRCADAESFAPQEPCRPADGRAPFDPIAHHQAKLCDTWGLDASSEARLSAWMHHHLELAIEICADPDTRETELVGRYAPPLNLTKCAQTAQHRLILAARAGVMARLQGQPAPAVGAEICVGNNECDATAYLGVRRVLTFPTVI